MQLIGFDILYFKIPLLESFVYIYVVLVDFIFGNWYWKGIGWLESARPCKYVKFEIEPFIAVKRDNFQHSQNHFIIVITDKWNHTVLAHITESSTDDDDDEGNDDDGNFGGSDEKNTQNNQIPWLLSQILHR